MASQYHPTSLPARVSRFSLTPQNFTPILPPPQPQNQVEPMMVYRGGLTQEQIWQMQSYYDSLTTDRKIQENHQQNLAAYQESQEKERQKKKLEDAVQQNIGLVINLTRQQNIKANMQNKDCSRGFYPYQPIELEQQARNIEKLQQQASTNIPDDVLEKVDDTIDFLEKLLENSQEVQAEIAAGKYLSGSSQKSTQAQTHMYQEFKASLEKKAGKEDIYDPQYGIKDKQQISRQQRESSNHDQDQNHQSDRKKKAMLQEMGVSEDGTQQQRMDQRRGLGALHSSSQSDQFDNFRNQRSKKYHVAAEERSKGIGREEQQLCYICQQPGHFAKDCKYGIN